MIRIIGNYRMDKQKKIMNGNEYRGKVIESVLWKDFAHLGADTIKRAVNHDLIYTTPRIFDKANIAEISNWSISNVMNKKESDAISKFDMSLNMENPDDTISDSTVKDVNWGYIDKKSLFRNYQDLLLGIYPIFTVNMVNKGKLKFDEMIDYSTKEYIHNNKLKRYINLSNNRISYKSSEFLTDLSHLLILSSEFKESKITKLAEKKSFKNLDVIDKIIEIITTCGIDMKTKEDFIKRTKSYRDWVTKSPNDRTNLDVGSLNEYQIQDMKMASSTAYGDVEIKYGGYNRETGDVDIELSIGSLKEFNIKDTKNERIVKYDELVPPAIYSKIYSGKEAEIYNRMISVNSRNMSFQDLRKFTIFQDSLPTLNDAEIDDYCKEVKLESLERIFFRNGSCNSDELKNEINKIVINKLVWYLSRLLNYLYGTEGNEAQPYDNYNTNIEFRTKFNIFDNLMATILGSGYYSSYCGSPRIKLLNFADQFISITVPYNKVEYATINGESVQILSDQKESVTGYLTKDYEIFTGKFKTRFKTERAYLIDDGEATYTICKSDLDRIFRIQSMSEQADKGDLGIKVVKDLGELLVEDPYVSVQ